MNLLDLLILLALLTGASGGWRLGFLRRAGSWIGGIAGLVLGIRVVRPAVSAVRDSGPITGLVVALLVVLGAAMIGQAIGFSIGSGLRRRVPHGPARHVDRVTGAVAGVAGTLVILWLLLPVLGDIPGGVASATRNSVIVAALDQVAPAPPDSMRALRTIVGNTSFPEVFSELRPAPQVGPPPATLALSPAIQQQVATSTVAVEAIACQRLQEGSGFAVADGTVVTNAHVVAGAGQVEVLRNDGTRLPAQVMAFDDDRDLAVLGVPDLARPPLPVATGSAGSEAAAFGYPLGQDTLRIAPVAIRERVTAVGRDIYGRDQVERKVFILSADLAQGDSGAAIIDPDGAVIAVAFAIAPDRPQTAYALTDTELTAVLGGGGQSDTGPCL
ncbi:MAG TPA: MarP family serine protease [Nitriliruptorales bacterium]|nr:MarP family serine protease [Nitriliruptorales bacterium]